MAVRQSCRMFSAQKAQPAGLESYLAGQLDAPLSYDEVGATLGVSPAGYHRVREQVLLGASEEVFRCAVTGLREWKAHTAAGVTVVPAAAAIEVGTTVALGFSIGPLHVLASCRVVAVVDETSRFGFAYGTLSDHPEQGEELFLIERDDADQVWFRIVAFSRAHDLLARLGGPITRRVQRRATQQYLEGLRAYCR